MNIASVMGRSCATAGLNHQDAMGSALAAWTETFERFVPPELTTDQSCGQRLNHVRECLLQYRSTAQACRASGLPRSTFYRLLKQVRRAS